MQPQWGFTAGNDWREACNVSGGTPAGEHVQSPAGGEVRPVRLAFDEMKGTDGEVRPAYSELAKWLGGVRPDVLDYRRKEAELLFRRIGITFAVYGEADAQERLIPFDVIPRILSAKEWDTLRRGLEQRVKAINAYLRDIYGRREILKAAIVPEDLVFQNPVFRPEMNGQKVPHDIYLCTSPASTWSGSTPTPSMCSRTTPAPPPGSPTCWRTARS